MKKDIKKWMFISTEGILLVVFTMLDLGWKEKWNLSNHLKYMSIVLCFFYVIFCFGRKQMKQDDAIVRLAIFFTLLSDTFLVLFDQEELGVTSFVCTQLCYWYRLHNYKWENTKVLFLLWQLVVLGMFVLQVPVDYLLWITCLYITVLVANVCYSLVHRDNIKFTIGLVLFLCCDLNVGVINLTKYLPMPEASYSRIYQIASVAIWTFYLPSQVLLVLSTKEESVITS